MLIVTLKCQMCRTEFACCGNEFNWCNKCKNTMITETVSESLHRLFGRVPSEMTDEFTRQEVMNPILLKPQNWNLDDVCLLPESYYFKATYGFFDNAFPTVDSAYSAKDI